MNTFYHLKDFFKENKFKYLLGIIALIGADILQLVMPKILGIITDALTENTLTMAKLYNYLFIILTVAVLIALCRYGWRIYIIGTSKSLEYWLRNKLFSHFETLSLNFFNKNKTGDLMAHATNDINALRMTFGPGIVSATDAFLLSIATIVAMIINIDIRLTLVALMPLLLICIFMCFMGLAVQKKFRIVQKAFSILSDKVQESLSGVRVIKSFAQEENDFESFTKINTSTYNKNMSLIKLNGLTQPVITLIVSLSYIITLIYGGYLVINESITLGQLVSFVTYLGLLIWPMMAIGIVVNNLQRGIASMRRLNVLLDTKPDIFDKEDVLNIKDIEGDITFNNLSFTYEGAEVPALKNIDLTIKKGKTLAIIGKTGSGKSTLVNLLLRLYNTEDNSLLIDGIDISKIPLKTLRENVGIVPQDNFLFSKSIRDNVAFSNKNESEENIVRATKIAQVYDEILSLPQGFKTELGERGVNLSGGQKQRISISRAIIKNPKILILDDSLSAVDTKTEEHILKYLRKEMNNRTSIIISHRISTIKDADEIILLDNGEIAERGTHEDLLSIKGAYFDLFEKQQLSDALENN